MHPAYDKYAELPSIINKWDNRLKLAAFFILAVSFAIASHVYSLILVFAVTVLIAVFSKLGIIVILKKLKAPLVFFVFILIILPFYPTGDPIFTGVYFSIYEGGLFKAIKIILRASCIIVIISIMLESSSFDSFIRALRSLRFPDFFSSLLLFTHRYIYLYRYRIRKMRVALKLRGYKNKTGKHSFKTIAGITAHVVIQSYEQSERVAQAMCLRGFNGHIIIHKENRVHLKDVCKFLLFILFSGIIIVAGVIF